MMTNSDTNATSAGPDAQQLRSTPTEGDGATQRGTAMHVYDNRSKMRYELSDGDELAAFVDYRVRDGRFWLPHTEILGRYQGTDAGSMLVRGALDDLRRRGVLVVPTCPYVAGWIRHHPEYDDLVDHETWREYKRSRGAGRRRATGSPTSTSRGTTPAHATMGAAGS